jgi:hypothetical protein
MKSTMRSMRGFRSFECDTRLFATLDALQLIERDFVQVPAIGRLRWRT